MSTFHEVLSAARALNTEERLRLAHEIVEDIAPEAWPMPDAEWVAEAQRRSAEYEAGRMSASAWEEVRTRARQRAGLDE